MSVEEILTIIWCCSFIVGLIFFIVFSTIYSVQRDFMRKQYLDTLDEHEKSVILTYTHIKPSFDDFKKNGKNK